MSGPYITYRGHKMTPPVRDALQAAEQRAGFQFHIIQGGFNSGGVAASAGTHDGDALDFRTWHLTEQQVATMIEALRWAGFAAWFRTTGKPKYGVRAHGFSGYHVHAVPNSWGSPSAGARRQAMNYRNGRDGLASDGPDVGPGHVSTYYGQTSPRTPIRRSWFDMATKKELEEVIRSVLSARDWDKVIPDKQYKKTFPSVVNSSWRNNILHMQQELDNIRDDNKRIEAKLDQLLNNK